MPDVVTQMFKQRRRYLAALIALVFAVCIATPIAVTAAAPDPLAVQAYQENTLAKALWENAVNLFKNPMEQVERTATIAMTDLLGPALAKALQGISLVTLQLAGWFLQAMSGIMDLAIQISITFPINQSTVVIIGWTLVRDFSNMFFIFALLYIAIQTILGLASGNTKRMLAHVIIAAVLINFSLLATTVVVDAGNIIAVSFWDKMKVNRAGVPTSSASQKFLGKFNLQSSLAAPTYQSGQNIDARPIDKAIINIGGTIFMVIAGYAFLAAALMMITRTIMLTLLMIFSPFAFMAFGLPKLEKYGEQWFEKLISQTFAAPFFIFMLYLCAIIVDNTSLLDPNLKGLTWSSAFLGQSNAFPLIYNFILLIGFLIASIAIANKFAGDTGSHARGWAKSATKWAGGAATGGAVGGSAWAARQTLGKFGMMTKDRQGLHDMAKGTFKDGKLAGLKGMLGRGAIAVSSGASRASFDVRGTKLGASALSGGGKIDIGKAGGAGGFETTGSAISKATLGFYGSVGTAKEKEILERAERRYKNDPKGKEAYLRANMGTEYKYKAGQEGKPWYEKEIEEKARYDTQDTHKDLRDKTTREVATEDAKNTIKKNVELAREAEQAGKDVGKELGKELVDGIVNSMKKLSAREIAEMMPKYAGSKTFMDNLSVQDYHAINQLEREGKYVNAPALYNSVDTEGRVEKDTQTNKDVQINLMERVAQAALRSKNEKLQEYAASPEGQGKLFNIPIERRKEDVDKIIERLNNAKEQAPKGESDIRKKLREQREKNAR